MKKSFDCSFDLREIKRKFKNGGEINGEEFLILLDHYKWDIRQEVESKYKRYFTNTKYNFRFEGGKRWNYKYEGNLPKSFDPYYPAILLEKLANLT